jgi:ABC-type transporter Mla MlaB component
MSWFNKKKSVEKPNSNVVHTVSGEVRPSNQWSPTMATTAGLTVEEGLTSIGETAAMAFANGNYDQAQSVLTQHLNETRGNTEKTIWHLLIDLYQIQRNKGQFDKLADLYAKKFSTSPPSWKELELEQKSFYSGRNVIVLEGGLDVEISDKVKDFLKVTKSLKTCKIECSRVDIEKSDPTGLMLWLDAMRQVRRFGAKAVLMGETSIMPHLARQVEESRENFGEHTQVYWLLLLELLQWQGKEAEFEDLAFDFASSYDVSPPGYDASGNMQKDGQAEKRLGADGPPQPPALLTEGALHTWLDGVEKWAKDKDAAMLEFSFSNVERITFEAVGAWSSWAHQHAPLARRMRINQPNHWVLVIMNMVNLLQTIKATNRQY